MSELEWAVQAAVVRIGRPAPGYDGRDDGPRTAFWGSGFFIAPGWVLTNAHVVDVGRPAVWRGERVIGITTESGEHFAGELACALPRPSAEERLPRPCPDPDLALVWVPEAVHRTNALWLSDRSGLTAPSVCTYGYSTALGSDNEPGFMKASGEANTPADGPMLLQGAFVPPGCSGGPVVDMQRGTVIGVNKGRVKGEDVARATPVTALRRFAEAGQKEAELWERVLSAHDRHHLQRFFGTDWSWPREQFELGRERDPGYALGFNAYDRAQLFGRFAELPPPQNAGEVLAMVQEARSAVRKRAVQLRTHTPRSWREGVGLLYDLNDGRSQGGRDDERAAVVLFAAQVCRTLSTRGLPPEWLAELRNWVWSAELDLEDDQLREKVRGVLKGRPAVSGSRTSYGDVIVEIDPDLYGAHPWRVKLARSDGQTSVVRGNETGDPREELEEKIRSALADALSQGDMGEYLAAVDFMLPRELFDEPVEQWRPHVTGPGEPFNPHAVPLGHRRTVALRDLHRWRDSGPTPEWYQRWRAVRQGRMAAIPLCPGHEQPEGQMTAWSRLSGAPLNAVPVHCSHAGSGHGAKAAGVALAAGYPAALWRRCGDDHDDCEEFRKRADRLLRSAQPDGAAGCLRELVREVRNQSPEVNAFLRELILLYDPPQHRGDPYDDRPLQAPQSVLQ